MTLQFEVWVTGRIMMLLKGDICWECRLICKGRCLKGKKLTPSHHHCRSWLWLVDLISALNFFPPRVKGNSKATETQHMAQCAVFTGTDSRDHWEEKLQSQEQDKIITSVSQLHETGQTDWWLHSGKSYLHSIGTMEKKKKPVQTKRKMENESFSRRYKGVYKGKSEGNHDTR